ncbi:MAG: NADH-quinone oxidoreductase subunit NuoE [Streptosporangiales bacterium]|nr:NADH-quinone oxidoreductase subunit NuoE [Streptosporangiales bacterium]
MPTPDTSVFDGITADADAIVARYPVGRQRSALLPMLHLVQSVEGYVSAAGIKFCAERLGLTEANVTAVVTFYSMYKRQPCGEYLVSVCTNTLCGMLGGDEIHEALKRHLRIDDNETTADGRISIEHAECLAACDYAPVVTVNYEFFDQQTPDSAVELVRALEAGDLPMPTRGAPPCTFRQIERQLAGFPDERPDALAGGGSGGEPTFAGLRLAESHGMADTDGDRLGGGGGDAASGHEQAGKRVPPTPQSGDREETTRVTSEEPPQGGVARKAAEHRDDAEQGMRADRGGEDD